MAGIPSNDHSDLDRSEQTEHSQKARSSIRIRASLHNDLRLLAAELAEQREMPITITSLLEEGIEGLFPTSLAEWIAWAREGRASIAVGEPSVSFRISTDLSRKLGVLAALISKQSNVPVTKIHLAEEAGRRIVAQIGIERAEIEAWASCLIGENR